MKLASTGSLSSILTALQGQPGKVRPRDLEEAVQVQRQRGALLVLVRQIERRAKDRSVLEDDDAFTGIEFLPGRSA
ncbi:hypothetical protein LP420_38045 [Massilia sp. B-10]|nr:hypothetical protein LP420_38045 [Massilia sp. B-10]